MTRHLGAPAQSRAGPDDFAVTLRRCPHPYQAMAAICSDSAGMSIDTFRELHRFMNTREKTSIGNGVGLDIAGSFPLRRGAAPASHSAVKTRRAIAAFDGARAGEPSPDAEEILQYMRVGWIDTVDGGDVDLDADGMDRRAALHGLDRLRESGVAIRVWLDCGEPPAASDTDATRRGRCGLSAGGAALLRAHGIEFAGNTDRLGPAAGASIVKLSAAGDGPAIFGFERCEWRRDLPKAARVAALYDLHLEKDDEAHSRLWVGAPQGLPYQITEEVLSRLGTDRHLCVFGQRLGQLSPLMGFDPLMAAAFRRLRQFQDQGVVLVARTSELLHYNRVRDHLEFAVQQLEGRLVIDITAVVDPVRGRWLPQIEDLRGITFDVAAGPAPELRLNGAAIATAEIAVVHQPGGRINIGVRWFEPDPTDHSAPFLAQKRSGHVIWSAAARAAAEADNSRVLEFLDDELARSAPGTEHQNAIRYAIVRHKIGLPHFATVFERLGLTGMQHGLDIGSGAGHWCTAFLRHNERVVGVEPGLEFVKLSSTIAEHLGFSDRSEYIQASGEDMQFNGEIFDCAWAHSVLMFVDVEQVMEKVSRYLRSDGLFYCGYTGSGYRLHDIYVSLSEMNFRAASSSLYILLAGYLHRCGVFYTPRSRVRSLDIEDLLRVCRTFGLYYVSQPNLQEGVPSYLGIPGAYDFVVRKHGGDDRLWANLRAGRPIGTSWLSDLDILARSGAPGFVCDLIRSVDPDPADAELRDLYARALILAGGSRDKELRRIFAAVRAGKPLPERTLGLYWHDQAGRRAADEQASLMRALEHYKRMAPSDADREFLIGTCLLHLKNWAGARQIFASAIDNGRSDTREWMGLFAAYHGAAEHEGGRRVFCDFVESRRAAGIDDDTIRRTIERIMRAAIP